MLIELMMPKIASDKVVKILRSSNLGRNIKVLFIPNLFEADAPRGLRNCGIKDYSVKANIVNDEIDTIVNNILKPKS